MASYLKCAICDKEDASVKFCSKCKTVAYCSVQHQKEDWTRHRKNCSWPILVQKWNGEGDQVELECVASRDVEAGEILLEETPILIASKITAEETGLFNCLTCGLAVGNVRSVRKCSGCGWPVCSVSCEKNKLHAENECKIFREAGGVPFPPTLLDMPPSEYDMLIFMLRGLNLKSSNPALYEKLMELKDTLPIPQCHSALLEISQSKGRNLNLLLNSSLDEQALRDCEKVFRIRRINAFSGGVEGQQLDKIGGDWAKLYDKVSRFNHSCVPNCKVSFSGFPELKIRIIAAVPLKKGDALTISYVIADIKDTFQRQQQLQFNCGFVCTCPRCLDPTECGTFTSAFKCQESNCYNGYCLPVDPLDLTSTSLYRCNQCYTTIFSSILRLTADSLVEGLKDQGETMENLMSFLGNGCGPMNLFHKNHWIIQIVTDKLIELQLRLGRPPNSNEVDRQWMGRMVERLKYTLEILNKTYPGFSTVRGMHLRLLAQISLAALQHYGRLLPFEEVVKLAGECRVYQKEARKFFEKRLFMCLKPNEVHPELVKLKIEMTILD